MPESASLSVLGPKGFYNLHYQTWGAAWDARPLVICVHALTRLGSDFAPLAEALEQRGFRVCAMDLPGRGQSDWLSDPLDYNVQTYLSALSTLIATFKSPSVYWVGTSLGGIIGMVMAALPNNPIQAMVINDVGPFIPKVSLDRICDYLGQAPHFETKRAAEQYLRTIHAPFGPLSDEQWTDLTERSIQRDGSGFRLHYDPSLAEAFRAAAATDIDMWDIWRAITCPVMVVRGVESDLLPKSVADQMADTKPGTRLWEIPDTGHAPTLAMDDQILAVADWLSEQG